MRFVLLVEFDHGARRRRETVMSRSHESRIKTNGVLHGGTDVDIVLPVNFHVAH